MIENPQHALPGSVHARNDFGEKSKTEYITVNTIGFGSLRLGKQLASKQILSQLCQVAQDDLLFVDMEGNELQANDKGLFEGLEKDNVYTVVEEKDLDRVPNDDNTAPAPMEMTEEQRMELFVQQQSKIQKMHDARRHLIQQHYTPLHPHLYQLSEEFLEPSFLSAMKSNDPEKIRGIFHKETDTGIFSFVLFTPKFCRELLEEVEHFEDSGLPIMRPNSMNNYGVILSEVGFTPFFDSLLSQYVAPFASLLYPQHGKNLDSHHPFIVQYRPSEDLALDFHYDDSEVTINVCLGKTFTGGSLYFRGLLEDPSSHNENFLFEHQSGKALVHIGKHRHGANPITSGERFNLIVWFRDSVMRSQQDHTCVSCGKGEHAHGQHHDHEH